MKERGGAGSILILDGGLERKPQFEAKLNITSAGMLDAFRKSETKAVLAQVENLVKIGCDLLVCKEGVDDEARQALSNHGILTYRRVEKRDLDLLSRACGANLVPDAGRATKEDLGAFIKTREELCGGVNHWILDAEDSGNTNRKRKHSKRARRSREMFRRRPRCSLSTIGRTCITSRSRRNSSSTWKAFAKIR